MKKILALVFALLMLILVPVEYASARGGFGGGGGFGGAGRGGGIGFRSRASRRDREKVRERNKVEDADALMRDAAGNRRGQ